jgi:hypothetical protein
MKKLSTGDDSTLGNYRKLSIEVFGAESPAVAYLDNLIAESSTGEDEEVLSDEAQMIYLLAHTKPPRH